MLSETTSYMKNTGSPEPYLRKIALQGADSIQPPFIVYQFNIKSGLISGNPVNLAAADKRHFGRHDRQELDVGIERQARHEQHGLRYITYIHPRFHFHRVVRLQARPGRPRPFGRSVSHINLTTGDIILAPVQ